MTFSKTTCTVSQSHALKSNEEGNLMFQDGAFLFFFYCEGSHAPEGNGNGHVSLTVVPK